MKQWSLLLYGKNTENELLYSFELQGGSQSRIFPSQDLFNATIGYAILEDSDPKHSSRGGEQVDLPRNWVRNGNIE